MMDEKDMPPAVKPDSPADPGAATTVKKGLSKKQKTVIAVVASVASIVLIVGIGVGVKHHNDVVAAQEAQAARLAKARAACDKSIDALVKAQDALAAKKDDKTVAAALKIKSSDVKDAKTIDSLNSALKDSSKAASCKATSVTALDAAAEKNQKTAKDLTAQAGRVSTAVKAVTDSQAAKQADDKAKADAEAAKKAQEAQAAAAAAAQAAQSQAQSQSSGSSSYSGSSYSGRRSYTPSYTAPKSTYTPPSSSSGAGSSSSNNNGWGNMPLIDYNDHTCDPGKYCPIG